LKRLLFVFAVVLTFPISVHSQGKGVSWERRSPQSQVEPSLFHSTQLINLPTAETLSKEDFQLEISHRFLPPVSEGTSSLYGLDGPAYIRLGLGYAITSRFMITLARSNQRDNVDLQLKYKVMRFRALKAPVVVGMLGGAAWNTEVIGRSDGDDRNMQAYFQLIINTVIGKKLAVGVVPSYLYNSFLESDDIEHALTVGLYGQYYLTKTLSLLAEWNIAEGSQYSEASYYGKYKYDAAAFGIELETGGHFFKIILSNSVSLNASQYLIGTNSKFKSDEWRLGFAITRLLQFWS